MGKNFIGNYNIGVDIGTTSVGWAVTSENGTLLKHKNKNMWGTRLFEEGNPAVDRRGFRSARRRYVRRKQRIRNLQELLAPMVMQKDTNFFRRMDESFLHLEDKIVPDFPALFDDNMYAPYPTIYHLRYALMTQDKKFDSRLVYLALHHIIKYRGNFIMEGQELVIGDTSSVRGNFNSLFELVNSNLDMSIDYDDASITSAISVLTNQSLYKKQQVEELCNIFKINRKDKNVIELFSAIVGNKFTIIKFIPDFTVKDDKGKDLSISFADDTFLTHEEEIYTALESNCEIIENMKSIYGYKVLAKILRDKKSISEAMISKYNKHHIDLKILKSLIKKHFNKDTYSNMFMSSDNEKNNNYAKYVHDSSSRKGCTVEDLYDSIKSLLKSVSADKDNVKYCLSENEKKSIKLLIESTSFDNSKYCLSENDYNTIKSLIESTTYDNNCVKYCLSEIEKETFLEKLNTKDNSQIPYQIGLAELTQIIENQGKYYPILLECQEKITQILTFRIPYYVGPMVAHENNKFSWVCKKTNDIVKPWNFNDIVDVEQSAEKFITKMIGKCTYLPLEDSIPKQSLLYSEYCVLNELNKVKIDRKIISVELKNKIYNNLFKKYKTVTKQNLINLLKQENPNIDEKSLVVEGFQGESKFAASLASYIDLHKVFERQSIPSNDALEQLILWITLFEDKRILRSKIEKNFPEFNKETVSRLCKLRYTGWSRLSKKLLNEITINTPKREYVTIIDQLRSSNMNFMQIINDDDLGFNKKIALLSLSHKENATLIEYDDVKRLAGSPAIKRGIWQTILVIKDIIETMGKDPENIFIEFAREDNESKRAPSRFNAVNKLYDKMKEDVNEYNSSVHKQLSTQKDNLSSKRMLLYFMQNGRCMYTNTPLDINNLSSYQIDHIIPQSIIKDDSIDNTVLVLTSANQNKGANLTITEEIRKKMIPTWLTFHKHGLISSKKLNSLTRHVFDEKDIQGFINRQLVETRQITKHVANILTSFYQNTDVYAIKAGLLSDFRHQFELYKLRELNDHHHAHDAYIASVVGLYINKRYRKLRSEFIYDEYKVYSKQEGAVKDKFGFIISSMLYVQADKETGEVFWQPSLDIDKVRKFLGYIDCFVTKKVEEISGGFYNQNLLPAPKKNLKAPSKLIRMKKDLDVLKYGGYGSPSSAFFVAVSYLNKKKTKQEIVGIPLYKSVLIKDENALREYLREFLETEDVTILKRRILRHQLIEHEKTLMYLASDNELNNATQLIINPTYQKLLHECFTRLYLDESSQQSYSEKLIKFFEYFIEKLQKHYPTYSGPAKQLREYFDKGYFISLSYEDKVAFVKELLKLTKTGGISCNLSKFSTNEIKLSTTFGRKSNYVFKEGTVFIDQSITGLKERKYTL